MCFPFLRVQGHSTGDSLCHDEDLEPARRALDHAQRSRARLALPEDLVIADRFDQGAQRRELDGVEVPDGWMGLDIGPRTAAGYAEVIRDAGTVFWNGPMGAFEMEPFAAGTLRLAQALVEVTEQGALTVVGGGDSAAAVRQLGFRDDQFGHISTGGGASLEYLEGKELPGIAILS